MAQKHFYCFFALPGFGIGSKLSHPLSSFLTLHSITYLPRAPPSVFTSSTYSSAFTSRVTLFGSLFGCDSVS